MTSYTVKLKSKKDWFCWMSPERVSLEEAKQIMTEFLRQEVEDVQFLTGRSSKTQTL